MTAILKALTRTIACPPAKLTILSDSLAAVKSQEWHSVCSRPDIKEEILKLIAQQGGMMQCNDSMDLSRQRNNEMKRLTVRPNKGQKVNHRLK